MKLKYGVNVTLWRC